MKVAWITLTSGRKEYLKKSRESWYSLVVGDISEEIIIDTSGDREYSNWLSETYKNAKVFVFPSLYEGFGLPIVEAMASITIFDFYLRKVLQILQPLLLLGGTHAHMDFV